MTHLNFDKLSDLKDHVEKNNLDLTTELLKFAPNRIETFKGVLKFLDKNKPKLLIETGTARGRFDINLKSMCGDGASTLLFAIWCSKNDAVLYTVDIDSTCIENSKRNIKCLGLDDYVEFIISDSVEFLNLIDISDIQFLYLDSYDFDYNNPTPSQLHHLKEYMAVKDKLDKNCCILIDDCALPYGGKGKYVGEKLIEDNFSLKIDKYQKLYEKYQV